MIVNYTHPYINVFGNADIGPQIFNLLTEEELSRCVVLSRSANKLLDLVKKTLLKKCFSIRPPKAKTLTSYPIINTKENFCNYFAAQLQSSKSLDLRYIPYFRDSVRDDLNLIFKATPKLKSLTLGLLKPDLQTFTGCETLENLVAATADFDSFNFNSFPKLQTLLLNFKENIEPFKCKFPESDIVFENNKLEKVSLIGGRIQGGIKKIKNILFDNASINELELTNLCIKKHNINNINGLQKLSIDNINSYDEDNKTCNFNLESNKTIKTFVVNNIADYSNLPKIKHLPELVFRVSASILYKINDNFDLILQKYPKLTDLKFTYLSPTDHKRCIEHQQMLAIKEKIAKTEIKFTC